MYALIAMVWIWLVPTEFAIAPALGAGLQSLLWLSALWALASGPLQVRTHRWPVAQGVVLGMLLLMGLSVAL
ncbi:hypothetical protein [Aquimonas voraii]|nr:hypothetical protein [Aquimonas voraii]